MTPSIPASRPVQDTFVSSPPRRVAAPQRSRQPAVALYGIGLAAFIVISRWSVAPRYLYYFDSANFALSLEKFDPALHQPQPPGYPLFVALIRLIHLFVADPQRVLLIAGLLAACAATVLIYVLTTDLFGRSAGILAAAILASTPVFWFGGVTNQVRIFLSLSVLGVGWLAWRALTRPGQPAWLYGAFAALGIAAGFRPAEAVLLIPLLAWVWWRAGRRIAPPLATLATALPWLAVTLRAVGGPARMLAIMDDYTHVQFRSTSGLYGAPAGAAWQMAATTFAWLAYGALVWLWALFAIRRPWLRHARSTKALFLGLALVPPALFCATVHIGDPDQALMPVSILCVLGGAVMSQFLQKIHSRRVYRTAVLLLAANCVLFFKPPYHLARAASYKAVRDVNRLTSSAIDTIAALDRDGPVTILHWGSPVASRQLEFYFPGDYVDVLPGSPTGIVTYEEPMAFHRHTPVELPAGASGLIHPDTRRILCLIPPNAPADALPGWRKYGPVYVLDRTPEAGLTLGPHRIVWDHPRTHLLSGWQ